MLSDKRKTKMQLILPMLFVLFVGLKLMGYIAWSWIWVTAPLWGAIIMTCILGYYAKQTLIKIMLHDFKHPVVNARWK